MPLSHGPTFLADIPDIGPYLSPTAGNLSHGPTFCMSGQLPVPAGSVHYGVIYGARLNDERERERDREPTVQKLIKPQFTRTSHVWYQNTRLSFLITGMSFFV